MQQHGSFWWRFKHPTIRDAFASLVAENRELTDIYLLGTPVERLLTEISCGNTKLRGIKVSVPDDRYESLMPRVESFLLSRRGELGSVSCFLASRCGRSFLARFVERNPDFVTALEISSYFYAVSDVDVIKSTPSIGVVARDGAPSSRSARSRPRRTHTRLWVCRQRRDQLPYRPGDTRYPRPCSLHVASRP